VASGDRILRYSGFRAPLMDTPSLMVSMLAMVKSGEFCARKIEVGQVSGKTMAVPEGEAAEEVHIILYVRAA
jgi:hypothetical protein